MVVSEMLSTVLVFNHSLLFSILRKHGKVCALVRIAILPQKICYSVIKNITINLFRLV